MSKPKEFEFRIQYNDNSYNIANLTMTDWSKVSKALEEGKKWISLKEMGLRLDDIKTISKLAPVPEKPDKPENKNQLGEWTWVDDVETLEWLQNQGIDVVEGASE